MCFCLLLLSTFHLKIWNIVRSMQKLIGNSTNCTVNTQYMNHCLSYKTEVMKKTSLMDYNGVVWSFTLSQKHLISVIKVWRDAWRVVCVEKGTPESGLDLNKAQHKLQQPSVLMLSLRTLYFCSTSSFLL